MWFDEIREIPKEHIPVLNEKFDCPDGFIEQGWTPDSEEYEFYMNEIERHL